MDTVDEFWADHAIPETKKQIKIWKIAGESASKKVKLELLAGKMMATCFETINVCCWLSTYSKEPQ